MRLEDRLPKFEHIVFHEKLGTQAERIERIVALAGHLAPIVDADVAKAERAAWLCKADLQTEVVGEFPEVQGLMGRYYAEAQGEDEAVAHAIEDHYKPKGPDDLVPADPVSVAVALADKIDILTGFWAIDEKPTGSKDPYALRRAALGVIRLVLDNQIRMPLLPVFRASARRCATATISSPSSATASRSSSASRARGTIWSTRCSRFAGQDDLVMIVRRIEALAKFLDTDDGKNLLAGTKRAANILRIEEKKDKLQYTGAPDAAMFQQAEEKELARAIGVAKARSRSGDRARGFRRRHDRDVRSSARTSMPSSTRSRSTSTTWCCAPTGCGC